MEVDETDDGEVSWERVDEEADDVLDLFDLFDERRTMKRGILKGEPAGLGGARGVSCATSSCPRRRVVYVGER